MGFQSVSKLSGAQNNGMYGGKLRNHCFSRVNLKAESPQTEHSNCPMRQHMGTSSTAKGCSSPVHYFNTVSSPAVSPGGQSCLAGVNGFGFFGGKNAGTHHQAKTHSHMPQAPANCHC